MHKLTGKNRKPCPFTYKSATHPIVSRINHRRPSCMEDPPSPKCWRNGFMGKSFYTLRKIKSSVFGLSSDCKKFCCNPMPPAKGIWGLPAKTRQTEECSGQEKGQPSTWKQHEGSSHYLETCFWKIWDACVLGAGNSKD